MDREIGARVITEKRPPTRAGTRAMEKSRFSIFLSHFFLSSSFDHPSSTLDQALIIFLDLENLAHPRRPPPRLLFPSNNDSRARHRRGDTRRFPFSESSPLCPPFFRADPSESCIMRSKAIRVRLAGRISRGIRVRRGVGWSNRFRTADF